MKYLRVKNWENFQHYKDRSPPWIKLHRDLLRDYEFRCLQDASKLHLMLIWLLASQMDNKIPSDVDFIKEQIGVKGNIDFKELIDKGFLVDDSKTLAVCKQVAIVETETETETEEEKKEVNPLLDVAVESYNLMAEQNKLPKILKLSDARKTKLTARMKDCDGIEGWDEAMRLVSDSPFLTGDNNRGWKADFDFIITESKFIKIIEGGYSNTTNSPTDPTNTQNQIEEIRQNGW